MNFVISSQKLIRVGVYSTSEYKTSLFLSWQCRTKNSYKIFVFLVDSIDCGAQISPKKFPSLVSSNIWTSSLPYVLSLSLSVSFLKVQNTDGMRSRFHSIF